MDNPKKIYPNDVAVCILAGGKGSRLGGIDKGLFLLSGRPLIEYCIERIRKQVRNITINANRNLEKYRKIGITSRVEPTHESLATFSRNLEI